MPIEKETASTIFLRFLKFGFLAWGGPIPQIAMIRKELVDEEKWISSEQFNRTLAVYQALPGPEAHELCVYFGMLAGGRLGGILAGLGFMLPGFLLILIFTWLYNLYGINSPVVKIIFSGFQAAVIALIFAAVHKIGKHALINTTLILISTISAAAYFLNISFFLILPLAGLFYVLLAGKDKKYFTLLIIPVIILVVKYLLYPVNSPAGSAQINTENDTTLLTVFFTGLKGGLLTFGGAYTVIPFIQQDAVTNYAWMTNRQFLDGIALAGILPAPLVIFTTFVGYFAALFPGAIIITIGMFLPAFSFTLLGYSVLQKVIEHKSLHNFFDGITAGVIGIIAVTAFQLFALTITDFNSGVIFTVAIISTYLLKSKLTAVFVMLISGILALLLTLW